MEMRVCRYCGEEKPIDQYETANTIKGKKYKRWKCRTCYCATKRDRRHKTSEWFLELKKTLSCKNCGDDRHYVLDLHHRDPNKKDICLANTRSWGKERILGEMKKCDVLCANCHREIHFIGL